MLGKRVSQAPCGRLWKGARILAAVTQPGSYTRSRKIGRIPGREARGRGPCLLLSTLFPVQSPPGEGAGGQGEQSASSGVQVMRPGIGPRPQASVCHQPPAAAGESAWLQRERLLALCSVLKSKGSTKRQR